MTRTVPDPAEATQAAVDAAAAADVVLHELHRMERLKEAQRLFTEVWRPAEGNPPPVTGELLRALAHAGSYVVGAFTGTRMVGASAGFFTAPPDPALHSHITGVAPGVQHRGVGFALKLHQRAWAMARGIPAVVWTFDPLVARNAWFNLAKLGAEPTAYLEDFYGPMTDAINAGMASDRLLPRRPCPSGPGWSRWPTPPTRRRSRWPSRPTWRRSLPSSAAPGGAPSARRSAGAWAPGRP
jgi:hypothetical protein